MSTKIPEKHYSLTIELEKGAEELLPEGIYDYAKKGIWIEEKGDASIIKCYPENIEFFLTVLKDSGLKIKDLAIDEETLPDYGGLTKKYFKTIKVNGVKIVPPWAKKIPQNSIIIEPGMAFGTGRHESTRLMFKLMQRIDFKGKEVIDLGCGSGILSIYASMLGAKAVVAVDNDLDAVLSAKKNAKLNKIENIDFLCVDLNDINRLFDVCLANLDIRTFQKNIKKLCNFLKDDSYFVVSGILKKDRKLFREIFKDFELIFEDCKNSWTGMILTQKTNKHY